MRGFVIYLIIIVRLTSTNLLRDEAEPMAVHTRLMVETGWISCNCNSHSPLSNLSLSALAEFNIVTIVSLPATWYI